MKHYRYYKKAKDSEKFIKQNEHMVKKVESGKKGHEDLSYFTCIKYLQGKIFMVIR